jgi:hypothetical protein
VRAETHRQDDDLISPFFFSLREESRLTKMNLLKIFTFSLEDTNPEDYIDHTEYTEILNKYAHMD